MNKKILFIAVHPDDETLGCGGTILKHKTEGDQIYWLIITSMVKGISNYTQSMVDERREVIQKVSQKYKFDQVYQLGVPTQLVHRIDFRELVLSIEKVINEVKPDTLYSMFNNDVHSDHRISFEAVYSCTKSFRKPFIKTIYMFEALSETEFAPALQTLSFVPNVYVDITDYMDKKLEIMSMYDTELMDEPYPRSLSSIEALARVRGSRAGVKYAEAFMLLYERK